jgi:glycosyltransferase involved in cell wall biosynthesis
MNTECAYPKLTVAIPTMRRWKDFLSTSLPMYLKSPYVDYVVICDETGEDVDAIRASPYATDPKLRLYKNKKRLGVYYNKRKCLEKATTDWVAVLDSDNFFQDDFFLGLRKAWDDGLNPHTIYAPGRMIRVYIDGSGKDPEERTAHFRGMRITKENWNSLFEIKDWNFLLNDGNWVGHKCLLNILPDDVDDKTVGGTDSIYIARKAVANGFTYWVVPEMSYLHTVHSGSHWLQTAAESTRLLMTRDWRI